MTIYHGSPVRITADHVFASGTFWTEDVEIARHYGAVIYRLETTEAMDSVLTKNWEGHYVQRRAIPISLTTIQGQARFEVNETEEKQ